MIDEYELTPVEKRGDFLFKRDDLYIPFDFSPVNGSKLRQCLLLMKSHLGKVDGVITGTSIKSPQAPIVASVAKNLNLPCTILYGGTTKDKLKENPYANICDAMGAKIEIASKFGYTTVLNKIAQEFANNKKWLNIRYGFDLINNLDVFIDSVANQVKNIPNVDNLVITVGSSITIIGVLYGILKYNKDVKRVYAIGVAPNRLPKIEKYVNEIYLYTGDLLPLNLINYVDCFAEVKGFKYDNIFSESYFGIDFHPRYEAKTFRWLKEQELKGTTLMWITGSDFKL